MILLGGVAGFAVVVSFCFLGGAAQYDSCTNGTVADIGNGRCDAANNNPSCAFDAGDCCACTCVDGPVHSCADSVFDCVYPDCDEPIPAPDNSTCFESWFSDGRCDESANNPVCEYDGGDVSFSQLVLIVLCMHAAVLIVFCRTALQTIWSTVTLLRPKNEYFPVAQVWRHGQQRLWQP